MNRLGVGAQKELEGRIAELMGLLNATTASLVSVLGEAIEQGAWEVDGIVSAEHWVTWQCGVGRGRARNLVRMARRLPELERCGEAFAVGALSEDQAGLLARHCPVERDAEVAGLAELMLVPQLSRLLSILPERQSSAPPEAATEVRDVSFGHDDRGNFWLRGHLPADEGALVQRALEAGREQVFAEQEPEGPDGPHAPVAWADGLVRAAELALQAHDGSRPPTLRTQVLVHVEAQRLEARLHGGPALPDALRRYLAATPAFAP